MSNNQIFLEDVSTVEQLKFLHLDSKYKNTHIIATAMVYLLLAALALLLLLMDEIWICILAECVVVLSAAVNLSVLPKACDFKGYALRDKDITYRSGLFFPKVTTIPFVRVQQVSVNQTPVSRLFRLYSVDVENGAQDLDRMRIPGLTEEDAMRIKNLITDKITNRHD